MKLVEQKPIETSTGLFEYLDHVGVQLYDQVFYIDHDGDSMVDLPVAVNQNGTVGDFGFLSDLSNRCNEFLRTVWEFAETEDGDLEGGCFIRVNVAAKTISILGAAFMPRSYIVEPYDPPVQINLVEMEGEEEEDESDTNAVN